MRKAVWALFVLFPLTVPAQSVTTIAPQQCVWHGGDDPAWAAADLNEQGWQPYSGQELAPDAPRRYWLRCHADLSSLIAAPRPGIQVSAYAAIQVFVNGNPIGTSGDMRSGGFSMDFIRSFPIPRPALSSSYATIAIRAAYPSEVPGLTQDLRNVSVERLKVETGDTEALRLSRLDQVVERTSLNLPIAAVFGVIGVVAVMLLLLWFYDRNRSELLLLSITCLFFAALRLNEFCAAALVQYPFRAFTTISLVSNVIAPVSETLFFFALARRRMPWPFWVFIGYAVFPFSVGAVELLFRVVEPAGQDELFRHLLFGLGQISRQAAPWVAFWPLWKITKRMRVIAGVCFLGSAANLLWFGIQITSNSLTIPGIPKLFVLWRGDMLEMRAIITAFVLIALLGLLFREQRQLTEERAQMAGEIAAGRSVQQYLIPAQLPPTPGIAIESHYRPAREVGGDFFQVLPQTADGSLLVVIGDVAGKGVEAGMLATLIVGAVRTASSFTSDPMRILALLNERLQGRGLVTCLALSIQQDGSAVLVNAGHLPPYLNGIELAMEGSLPLGAEPGISFPVSRFQLAERDSLILMTDGVAEAQNAQGQLFGFEHINELLHRGANAAALAEAAQQFGQKDDITVLTLTRLRTGELSSTELAAPALARA